MLRLLFCCCSTYQADAERPPVDALVVRVAHEQLGTEIVGRAEHMSATGTGSTTRHFGRLAALYDRLGRFQLMITRIVMLLVVIVVHAGGVDRRVAFGVSHVAQGLAGHGRIDTGRRYGSIGRRRDARHGQGH